MKSQATPEFWDLYYSLPLPVRNQVREAYRLFLQDENHPSLQFKRLNANAPVYSARVSEYYRVIGQLDGDTVVWFWVGPHSEYDRLVRRRNKRIPGEPS